MPTRDHARRLRAIRERLSNVLAERRARRSALRRLATQVDALNTEVKGIRSEQHRHALALQAIYDDEPGNRRRLWGVRASPEYERPFEEENPLVTVYVTTYSNAEGLVQRSIPSILGQTYENLEVIVVGDAATAEVEEAVRSFDDPRLRFVNLTIRGPYPDDPVGLWYVAGTSPANEGLRLATGQWIAMNCDDDSFTPDHVKVLLDEARSKRLEIVYGKIRRLDPSGPDIVIGTFPSTEPGQFGMQATLIHGGLRIFPFELVEAVFGAPGDYAWMRRMIRLGVRIGMIDDVVVDYYPSQLWGTPARPRGLLG